MITMDLHRLTHGYATVVRVTYPESTNRQLKIKVCKSCGDFEFYSATNDSSLPPSVEIMDDSVFNYSQPHRCHACQTLQQTMPIIFERIEKVATFAQILANEYCVKVEERLELKIAAMEARLEQQLELERGIREQAAEALGVSKP